MRANKGDWVRIHDIVMSSEDRAPQVPEDTKQVPLELWVKGFLLNAEAKIGDRVEVETIIGRHVKGSLIEVNPQFDHSWGRCVPELLQIGKQLRGMLASEERSHG